MAIVLQPIGWVCAVENGAAINIPREDYWGGVVSAIRLDEGRFSADALLGLTEFSHIEVLFHLHGVGEEAVIMGSRHPRGNPAWPEVGIFAQRAKARPNRVAATICSLLSVRGVRLTVQGLDALEGSPVLDIKPVFAEFLPDRSSVRQAQWSREMMAKYFASGEE